ncbi:MAG: hypothetical protein AAGI63_11920 [Planctomycetota bacterium]
MGRQLSALITKLVAVVTVTFMLMDTGSAVEVSDSFTPPLPQPTNPETETGSAETVKETTPSKGCFILGSRTFSIPFTVNAAGVQPAEVHVFVKRGQSTNWNLLERKRPDATSDEFQFTAKSDGEYWFATRTIDSRGRPHPTGSIEPQLKVYVDTTKPMVDLSVDADADGSVAARIAVQEATPLQKIQLRYATDSGGKWKQVDLQELPKDGVVSIQPDESWKQISVQCIVTDTPGNQGVIQRLVKRPRVAVRDTNRFASSHEPIPDERTDVPGGLRIQPAPYRTEYTNRLRTETVSNPVIQLDRHRNPPQPTAAVETAIGYADNPGGSEFRGMQMPGVPSSENAASVRQRDDAQRIASQPPSNTRPQVAMVAPQLESPPSLSGFPLPSSESAADTGAIPPAANNPAFNNPAFNSTPNNTGLNNLGLNNPAFSAPQNGPNESFASQFAQPQTKPFNPSQAEEVRAPAGVPEQPVARPRTAAEAMRPLEPSAANQLRATNQGAAPDQASLPNQGTVSNQGMVLTQDAASSQPTSSTPSPAPSQAPERNPVQTREAIPVPKPDAPTGRSETSTHAGTGQDTAANGGSSSGSPQRSRRVDPSFEQLSDSMQRAPHRYSDSVRFSLDYELEAVGSLGVEAIELYGTVDNGKTWQLWGRDPDRSSPFDIETKEQGVFGFRIVVVGQNGLASPRPLSGESPDIVVVVDTVKPTVRITGAQYGEGDRIGSLVIRYECGDPHLQQRPVALSFSDSLDGPWTTIAAGLRNDGDYVWPADPKLPRRIYLRIDVTDEAGNVGTYVLEEPIDAQGLAPRARIRGFQSLSGEVEPPADGQTATRSWSIFQ